MRFLLLVVVVALFATEVSGGWFRRATRRIGRWIKRNKARIIGTAVHLIGRRSIDDIDLDGDGVLTRSELLQHMDARDVDDLLEMLDEDDEGHVKRDVLEGYAEEALAHSE